MLTRVIAFRHHAAAVAVSVLLAAPPAALAQGKLEIRYGVTMTGINVGTADLTLDIASDRYKVSASGRAAGMLSAIVSGEGTVAANGTIRNGKPWSETFTSRIVREGDKADTTMTVAEGSVVKLVAETPKPVADRVPVTDAHRKGIVDPVSALLIPAANSTGDATREACERTLPVFDGRRRYDLTLTFKRMDKVRAATGYSGPVAVCAVRFAARAGHRANSALVKFLSEGRDIEMWLAPVAGARLLAPYRVSVASMFGSLVVEATRFDVVTQTAAAAQSR